MNVKRILKSDMGLLDTFKLLLLAASYSRPQFRQLCSLLLRPFVHHGLITVHYQCFGRRYKAYIRMSDEQSDYTSVLELSARGVYNLNPAFAADLVIDGGGNIGLFSLYASAVYPAAQIVICEPVPHNIAQIETHLGINHVTAKILPVCLGGSRRTIPFYVREANQGSFDSAKPYAKEISVDVLTLPDVIGSSSAERICIKLDIEGMEIEVLDSYIPSEKRAVCIFGELHDHKENKRHLERIFGGNGWPLQFEDETDAGSLFEAWSPAAVAALAVKTA